jgi:hypothetical protein
LLVALALLGLGWAFAPRSAPPLYDGVGFPDQPYRFVVKPDGARDTKPPTTATATVAVIGGAVAAVHAASAEQAPQVSLLIPTARLQAPSGTGHVTVRAVPVQPVDPPAHGYLWSNVYDVKAVEPGVTLKDADPAATITLRAATAQRPYPTIERYTAQGWTKIKTVPTGTDIYQARLPALGRYAVIGSSPIDVSQLKLGGGETPATNVGIIVSVIAIVIVVALFIIGERRRSRARRAKRQEASS